MTEYTPGTPEGTAPDAFGGSDPLNPDAAAASAAHSVEARGVGENGEVLTPEQNAILVKLDTIRKTPAYNNANDPAHAKAVWEHWQLMQQLYPDSDDKKTVLAELPDNAHDLFRNYGVQEPELPSTVEFSVPETADFLQWARENAIPSVTVSRLLEHAADAFIIGGGQITPEMETDFHARFSSELNEGARNLLLRFFKETLAR